jgi:transcription elongation factor GreA
MAETKKVPLTQAAVDRLKEELDHLEGEAREQIIKEIATARAHGDLSENAEYHSAKDQQGMQEGRVRQIRAMLENAEIIEATDDGVIKPGMTVTIRSEGEDADSYFLGTREEKGGVELPVLTPESPMGKALMGHSAGDKVTVDLPNDSQEVIEVVEVKAP